MMGFEAGARRRVVDIPEDHVSVIEARNQPEVVGEKSDGRGTRGLLLDLKNLYRFQRGRVPEEDFSRVASGCDETAIGRQREARQWCPVGRIIVLKAPVRTAPGAERVVPAR